MESLRAVMMSFDFVYEPMMDEEKVAVNVIKGDESQKFRMSKNVRQS